MPLANTPNQRSGRRRRGEMHRRQGLHRLRRRLPARRAAHLRADRQGLHELRRVLVLHAVRGRLPDRRGHRQHSLSAAVSACPSVFEAFDDLDDVEERAARRRSGRAARRGHGARRTPATRSGPALAAHGRRSRTPACGCRWRSRSANSTGRTVAAALARLLVDPEAAVATRRLRQPGGAEGPGQRRPDLSAGRARACLRAHVRRSAASRNCAARKRSRSCSHALRDRDASVREQAVGVIGWLKLEESVPALIAAAADPDAHVRRGAISALASPTPAPPATASSRRSRRRLDGARDRGRDARHRARSATAADPLIAALSDEFWQVRLKAVRSLGSA